MKGASRWLEAIARPATRWQVRDSGWASNFTIMVLPQLGYFEMSMVASHTTQQTVICARSNINRYRECIGYPQDGDPAVSNTIRFRSA